MSSNKKVQRVIRMYGIAAVDIGDTLVRRLNTSDIAAFMAYRRAADLADNILDCIDTKNIDKWQLLLKFAELQRQFYRLFWDRFELDESRAYAVKYSGRFLVIADINGGAGEIDTGTLAEVG